MKEYKSCGINRLSIGLQSTNDRLLKLIGRIHTYSEFLKTYKLAKKIGFKNINVDLIIGLPSQTLNDIKQDIQNIIELNPSHISTYSLIIEEGTVLEKKLQTNEFTLPNEITEREMYWFVKNTLEQNGFIHYEISNFAKDNLFSIHNMNCWSQKEYIGFGIAAHSYLDNVRYSNIENIEHYISNINENNIILNRIIHETQVLEDMQKEYMLLGLRKIKGISIKEFKAKFAQNPIYLFKKELKKLTADNLIYIDGDKIMLTSRGIDFANIVWEEFI